MKTRVELDSVKSFFRTIIELGRNEIVPTQGMMGDQGLILMVFVKFDLLSTNLKFASAGDQGKARALMYPDTHGRASLKLHFETDYYMFVHTQKVMVAHYDTMQNGWTEEDFLENPPVRSSHTSPQQWLSERNKQLELLADSLHDLDLALTEMAALPLKISIIRPAQIIIGQK